MQTEVVVLSFAAGAVHMIAPDHWIPGSILAWRREWSSKETLSFSLVTFLMHLTFGVALYFALEKALGLTEWGASQLTLFAASLILGGSALRALRFQRVRAVLGALPSQGMGQVWALWSTLALLGPAESLVPVLAKTQQLGVPSVWVIAAFTAGSVLSGLALVFFGKVAWDRPFWLPRVLDLAQKDAVALSFAVGMILGLSALWV